MWNETVIIQRILLLTPCAGTRTAVLYLREEFELVENKELVGKCCSSKNNCQAKLL